MELTLYQTVLFFSYLFNEAKVDCSNTDKAKIISMITGYNSEKIRQNLSSLHKKASLNFVAYEKDIAVVTNLFKKIKLSNTVETIEKEVEKIEAETLEE